MPAEAIYLEPGTEIRWEVTGMKNDCVAQLRGKASEVVNGPNQSLLTTAIDRVIFALAQQGGGAYYKIVVEITVESWDKSKFSVDISKAETQ